MAKIVDYQILKIYSPAQRVALYMKDKGWGYLIENNSPENIEMISIASKNLNDLGVNTEVPKNHEVDAYFENAKETIDELIEKLNEYILIKQASNIIQ